MSSDLRTVMKVLGEGAEQIVRMRHLRKHDRFRLIADHPDDHLHGKESVVYEALSDAYQREDGHWVVEVEGEVRSGA